MKKLSWKWLAVNCALILAIAAAFAVAASSNDGGSGQTNTNSPSANGNGPIGPPPVAFRRGPGPHLTALAKALGVSEAKLRDALESVRSDLGPPKPPGPGSPPSRADLEKRCTALTDALGSKLGKTGDEVRTAIKSVLKADIEKAVDAKRLTRQQADKILGRINSADCLPPLGPPGAFGIGCHGHAPRPGGDRSGTAIPAPPPGGGYMQGAPPV
jgi:hypothetical protein